MYGKQARLLWSLTTSGLGTTISEDGDSGDWAYTAGTGSPRSAITLAQVADVALYVTAGDSSGSPSVVVSLGAFDDQGNLFASLVSVTAVTGAGSEYASGGLHTSPGLVLPLWGQVAWAFTGSGSLTGVEIALYGR